MWHRRVFRYSIYPVSFLGPRIPPCIRVQVMHIVDLKSSDLNTSIFLRNESFRIGKLFQRISITCVLNKHIFGSHVKIATLVSWT